MEVAVLGAGQEVGRSCFLVRFPGGERALLDCGAHLGKQARDRCHASDPVHSSMSTRRTASNAYT